MASSTIILADNPALTTRQRIQSDSPRANVGGGQGRRRRILVRIGERRARCAEDEVRAE